MRCLLTKQGSQRKWVINTAEFSRKGDGCLMQINILFVYRGCHVSRLLFPPKQDSLTPAGLFLSLGTKGFKKSEEGQTTHTISYSDRFQFDKFILQFVSMKIKQPEAFKIYIQVQCFDKCFMKQSGCVIWSVCVPAILKKMKYLCILNALNRVKTEGISEQKCCTQT